MLTHRSVAAFLALALTTRASAQNPIRYAADAVEARFARSQPVVHYAIRVDSSNLSAFDVEMHIRNAPDTFRLAMSAHPEYDDKYWRFLQDLRVDGPHSPTIARLDSSLWRMQAPGGAAVVRYRIQLPPDEHPRAAWKPFLSATGGLIGGPHSFMYIVGFTLAPVHVSLALPASWDVATGLTPTSDPHTFYAATFDNLVEGPIFAGHFKSWRFAVDGVPHRVVYWPAPNATPFDTTRFVGAIQRVVQQAVALFGRPPWREYTFIIQDDAWGGLEHANSVTLGASSAQLARSALASLPETAHEFFHAWNLVRIRPVEYRTVDYRVQPPTSSLWFSEGLTIFYADLLTRRADLPTADSTRIQHLSGLIARYLNMPGLAKYSAERVSQVAYNAEAGALGDYGTSTHLHGEVIGAMLDLVIRDATDGRRSMDDVMRLMFERFGGTQGFTGRDVERAVEDVCGCDVTPFFDAHVRSGSPIAFDRYLAHIGLRPRVEWVPAINQNGEPVVDVRLYAADAPPGQLARLVITNPNTPWAKAGLHTGDRIVSVNGAPVRGWLEFRQVLQRMRIGDSTRVEVERAGQRLTVTVVAVQQPRPIVRLEELAGASPKATRLRSAWAQGR